MKQKRLLSLLVLLMMAATGAVAQTAKLHLWLKQRKMTRLRELMAHPFWQNNIEA